MKEHDDYIFRFKIEEVAEEVLYDHPTTEMIRSLFSALLDVVSLEYGGKEIKVDAFKFINDPEVSYGIWSKQ